MYEELISQPLEVAKRFFDDKDVTTSIVDITGRKIDQTDVDMVVKVSPSYTVGGVVIYTTKILRRLY